MRFDRFLAGAACALALVQGPEAARGHEQLEPVWVTNHGARLVIGQESFTRQDPHSSRSVLGAAQGVAYAGNRLFVADGNRLGALPVNNRILIYGNVSSFIPRPDALLPQHRPCPACVGLPDTVLGQPDFDASDASDLPDTPGLNNPSAVHSDGIRLAVADTNNNRVLLWNTIPTTNGVEPDVVLGQSDFSGRFPETSATGMRGPQGVWLDGGRLFVADTQNSRVWSGTRSRHPTRRRPTSSWASPTSTPATRPT